MLKFSELTKSQKRCIVKYIHLDSSLKENPEITLHKVGKLHALAFEDRGSLNEKIGYPNWLFKNNKVKRGVYMIPVPSEQEMQDYISQTTQKNSKQPSKKDGGKRLAKLVQEQKVAENEVNDVEFLDELKKYGITI